MKLADRQNALAKFFTEENFRNKILSEKEAAKDLLDEFGDLSHRDLADFAESLIHKRLHEAEKMLPLTCELLNKDFVRLFKKFTTEFSPQSVKKHLEDSLRFAEFLQTENVGESIKASALYEQGKLEFYGCGKSFVFKKFNCSIRRISGNLSVREPEKTQNAKNFLSFAVWLKIAGKIKHINFP